MAFNNDVRLIGYCAAKPKMTANNAGIQKTVLVVYTRDFLYKREVTQAHRCVATGKKAEVIFRKADKGKHVYIRGMSISHRVGEGKDVRYYNNVIVEDFSFTPVQGMLALEKAVREIMEEEAAAAQE